MHHGVLLYASTLCTYGKHFLSDNNECECKRENYSQQLLFYSNVATSKKKLANKNSENAAEHIIKMMPTAFFLFRLIGTNKTHSNCHVFKILCNISSIFLPGARKKNMPK